MFFFKKKDKSEEVIINNDNEAITPDRPRQGFTFGVMQKFAIENSEDVMLVGNVKGKIKKGEEAYVVNFGDDDTPTAIAEIIDLEIGDGLGNFDSVEEAKDTGVSIRISGAAANMAKPGTVFHSKNSRMNEIRAAYIDALGDAYIGYKNYDLSDEDIEIMSLTDLYESWKVFGLYSSSRKMDQDEQKATYLKIDRIANAIIKKLFELDHIYAVYNKNTNEPHMFSSTVRKGDTYECSKPNITLVTDAYYNVFGKNFKDGVLELRKIENGEDKSGIRYFLGNSFYVNGAQGLEFLYGDATIGAENIIHEPDWEKAKSGETPIMNPNVERWILLIGQIGMPKDEKEKVMINLYYRFLSKALLDAKLVVPTKMEDENLMKEAQGTSGKVEITGDTKLQVAVQDGKAGRKAVRMYTDWLRLREEYGEEWGGTLHSIEEVIDKYDVALNVGKFPLAGSYISKTSFEAMKKLN